MTLTPVRLVERRRLAPEEAYAQALAGQPCAVEADDGTVTSLQSPRWLAAADHGDQRLFVDPCAGSDAGPTLDVGCGPGRLLVALQDRAVDAHGIDISPAAVAHARRRGASASRHDVFDAVPHEGSWAHVLLADGNVGIGGDPARLLARTARLLRPGGRLHVEVCSGDGAGRVTTQRLRLRVGDRASAPFRWATVGCDAIGWLAQAGGLRLLGIDRHDGRHVAVLARPSR